VNDVCRWSAAVRAVRERNEFRSAQAVARLV
jgi:hypothetical protein